MIAHRMYIVLLDGADVRFLGGSARARNARIIQHVSAAQCSLADLPSRGSSPAMLVPAHIALTPALFDDRGLAEAARESTPSCLQTAAAAAVHGGAAAGAGAAGSTAGGAVPAAGAGASVIVGAASLVAELANDRAAWSALPQRSVTVGTLFDITTVGARRLAARAVLRSTGKTTDGWVSRRINRPVSRVCSLIALEFGFSANTASLVTLLVGLACAWVAAQPGYLAVVMAGVLFQLASILDGVDGEIARATVTESASGARIDTIVDQATYVAAFLGVTIGWAREGGAWLALQWTSAAGLALLVSLVRGARFVAQHGEDASFVLIDRSVRRAARDTNALPLRAAAGAFALLRRDMFAVIFLAVSLTGVRLAVPALLLAGCAIANATLSFYGRELAAAAHAERRKRSAVHAGS